MSKVYFYEVKIRGNVRIGKNVSIGFWTEINGNRSSIIIGDGCDIGSFCSINVADSHKKCIGLMDKHEYAPITLEHSVFVGSHCMIKGGAHVGHHSVVAAGTVVDGVNIPPYSLVSGNPMAVKERYYRPKNAEWGGYTESSVNPSTGVSPLVRVLGPDQEI